MTLSTIQLNDPDKVWQDKSAKSIAYFCKTLPARIDNRLLNELKTIARQNAENVRICLHNDPQAEFQEMIVMEWHGKYRRPHKHSNKGESFHIIDGRMAVFVFDDEGEILDSCVLDLDAGNIIYRVEVNKYHGVMPISEYVIYHESKPGPFLGDGDSIFPSWAPEDQNEKEVSKFMEYLYQVANEK